MWPAVPVQFNSLPNQSSNLAILVAVLNEELVAVKATVCQYRQYRYTYLMCLI